MAITGYMESSLSKSEIWEGLNNSDDTNGTLQKAINLIKTAKHLTNEDIEPAYIAVKQITDTLTREALKAFDSNIIHLVYNNVADLSVTQALPFITMKTKKGYETFVFVDKYIKVSRDGMMSIQSPILRDLLISALIANGIKKDYSVLANNQYLQKTTMSIYCKMVCRTLNRLYSIMPDKILYDTVQYWVNRFFLSNVFNAIDTPENLEKIATEHFKFIDELKYEDIKREYNEANISKFGDLLALLQTASPRLKSINKAQFLSDWLVYYYIPSMLAIDNIEYLIFVIISLLNGDSIISMSASDIVKETKGIKSIKTELLKLVH